MRRQPSSWSSSPGHHIVLVATLVTVLFWWTPPRAEEGPKAVFPNISWDFGYLSQKSEVSHTFYLRNDGTAPLTVEKIEVDCSCVTTSKVQEPIAPGDSTAIIFTFKSGRYHGSVAKSARITTNDPERPIQRVRTHADVIKDAEEIGTVLLEPLKLKLRAKDSHLTMVADTLEAVNIGSDSLRVALLLLPDAILKKSDLPESIAPSDTAVILLHFTGDKLSDNLNGLSATFSFGGKDTTIVTIPIELED